MKLCNYLVYLVCICLFLINLTNAVESICNSQQCATNCCIDNVCYEQDKCQCIPEKCSFGCCQNPQKCGDSQSCKQSDNKEAIIIILIIISVLGLICLFLCYYSWAKKQSNKVQVLQPSQQQQQSQQLHSQIQNDPSLQIVDQQQKQSRTVNPIFVIPHIQSVNLRIGGKKNNEQQNKNNNNNNKEQNLELLQQNLRFQLSNPTSNTHSFQNLVQSNILTYRDNYQIDLQDLDEKTDDMSPQKIDNQSLDLDDDASHKHTKEQQVQIQQNVLKNRGYKTGPQLQEMKQKNIVNSNQDKKQIDISKKQIRFQQEKKNLQKQEIQEDKGNKIKVFNQNYNNIHIQDQNSGLDQQQQYHETNEINQQNQKKQQVDQIQINNENNQFIEQKILQTEESNFKLALSVQNSQHSLEDENKYWVSPSSRQQKLKLNDKSQMNKNNINFFEQNQIQKINNLSNQNQSLQDNNTNKNLDKKQINPSLYDLEEEDL